MYSYGLAESQDCVRARAASSESVLPLQGTLAFSIKRLSDIVISVLLMALLSWVALLVWFGVMLTTGAPALYRHPRVGMNGRKFMCLKFRSMVRDSDRVLGELLERCPAARAEWALSRKLRNDPRVTRFGRFIRRFCLDELPQLWNVLVGDMSMVGPRPVTQEELHTYYLHSAFEYSSARPGLTGLWQIGSRGRSDLNYQDRIRCDLHYSRRWSLRLDLLILVQTPIAILLGRNSSPTLTRSRADQQKIVHVITRFLHAGSEENTLDTCLAQVQAGHEVVIVHGAVFDAAFIATVARPHLRFHQISSLVHPIAPLQDLQALLSLTAFFKSERPDVVHTHQSKAGIIGRFAARLAKVPHVIHGVHIVPFDNVGSLQKAMYLVLEKLAARYTDGFISVCDGVRDVYLQHGIGAAAQHFVVHAGMHLQKFVAAQVPDDLELLVGHYPVRPQIVLMLAAYEPRKRHAQLLASFKNLASRNPQIHLVFAGTGTHAWVHKLVSDLELTQRVSVLPCHPDPQALIAMADICILSSLREGLPRVVVQYLAAGKPVVISRLCGIEELIVNGRNGYITSAWDLDELVARVELLATNAEKLAAMSQDAAATQLNSWDASQTSARMAEAYRAIAA